MSVNIWSYGNYASGNYGVNAMAVSVGSLSIYFSYKTPVAFQHPAKGLVIRENDWRQTTGKHLNMIDDDHSKRISGAEFEEKLNDLLIELSLTMPRVSA